MLDFELERGLDDKDKELDDLVTTIIELDFEFDKLDERDDAGKDDTELIAADESELLLTLLTVGLGAAELDVTGFLLELDALLIEDDFVCEELLDDSPSPKPAAPPHAVNKKNSGIKTKALIFYPLTSTCPV